MTPYLRLRSTSEADDSEKALLDSHGLGIQESLSFMSIYSRDALDMIFTWSPAAFIVAALCIFILSFLPGDLDQKCTARMFHWSPMIETFKYEWTSLDPSVQSVYTSPPSDEVEAAWDELWNYGAIGIDDDKVNLLNKSNEVQWVHLDSDKPRYGGKIGALYEGYHRLHCLSLLRQYTFKDSYDFSDRRFWYQAPDVLFEHVEHCIENIRSIIHCNADVTPYLIERDLHSDMHHMRLNLNKSAKCRNWDNIMRYGRENTLPVHFAGTAE
ncbi:hypothetical protein NA57DRAFT_77036 [Rhizodiscina lignyota]|uniref:Cyclochlorotine biosynthesis protein O n=1 Tax=Rhizodiscina lignyota TaxID=1504668 RepID=A0A9P4M9Y5_9PEZI|nr:hypothetical protein NA57DRAFT_77036 [Rhizodiscina lignyota]